MERYHSSSARRSGQLGAAATSPKKRSRTAARDVARDLLAPPHSKRQKQSVLDNTLSDRGHRHGHDRQISLFTKNPRMSRHGDQAGWATLRGKQKTMSRNYEHRDDCSDSDDDDDDGYYRPSEQDESDSGSVSSHASSRSSSSSDLETYVRVKPNSGGSVEKRAKSSLRKTPDSSRRHRTDNAPAATDRTTIAVHHESSSHQEQRRKRGTAYAADAVANNVDSSGEDDDGVSAGFPDAFDSVMDLVTYAEDATNPAAAQQQQQQQQQAMTRARADGVLMPMDTCDSGVSFGSFCDDTGLVVGCVVVFYDAELQVQACGKLVQPPQLILFAQSQIPPLAPVTVIDLQPVESHETALLSEKTLSNGASSAAQTSATPTWKLVVSMSRLCGVDKYVHHDHVVYVKEFAGSLPAETVSKFVDVADVPDVDSAITEAAFEGTLFDPVNNTHCELEFQNAVGVLNQSAAPLVWLSIGGDDNEDKERQVLLAASSEVYTNRSLPLCGAFPSPLRSSSLVSATARTAVWPFVWPAVPVFSLKELQWKWTPMRYFTHARRCSTYDAINRAPLLVTEQDDIVGTLLHAAHEPTRLAGLVVNRVRQSVDETWDHVATKICNAAACADVEQVKAPAVLPLRLGQLVARAATRYTDSVALANTVTEWLSDVLKLLRMSLSVEGKTCVLMEDVLLELSSAARRVCELSHARLSTLHRGVADDQATSLYPGNVGTINTVESVALLLATAFSRAVTQTLDIVAPDSHPALVVVLDVPAYIMTENGRREAGVGDQAARLVLSTAAVTAYHRHQPAELQLPFGVPATAAAAIPSAADGHIDTDQSLMFPSEYLPQFVPADDDTDGTGVTSSDAALLQLKQALAQPGNWPHTQVGWGRLMRVVGTTGSSHERVARLLLYVKAGLP